jgi:hypothetical protein
LVSPALDDIDARNRLFEIGEARFGDLGLPHVERLQCGEAFELPEARVRDLGAVDVQVLELLQVLEMGQALVGNGGAFE